MPSHAGNWETAIGGPHPSGNFDQATRHRRRIANLRRGPCVTTLFSGGSEGLMRDAQQRLEEEERLQDAQSAQTKQVPTRVMGNLVPQEGPELFCIKLVSRPGRDADLSAAPESPRDRRTEVVILGEGGGRSEPGPNAELANRRAHPGVVHDVTSPQLSPQRRQA